MIPKIIHQFWAGDRTELAKKCMCSVSEMHPSWEIVVWSPEIVGRLGIDCELLMRKCGNWASVSNIVRLYAVHSKGGVWIDSDCEMLKPIDPLTEHDAFAAIQDGDRICNAVFGACAGHEFVGWQLNLSSRLETGDAAEGVYLMSEAPREGLTVVPTDYFYPFLWTAPKQERVPTENSFMVHHWSGSWT